MNSNVEDDDRMEGNDQEDKVEDDGQEEDDVRDEDEDEGQDNGQEGKADDGQEGKANDGQEGDEALQSEAEEDIMDACIEASRCKPKEEIQEWKELRDKLKADLEVAHKQNESLTHMKELLVLQNFATL